MISKYFLEDCFKNPRNRTHIELQPIMDLLYNDGDPIDDLDKLGYFILEVADRAYEDGQKNGDKANG